MDKKSENEGGMGLPKELHKSGELIQQFQAMQRAKAWNELGVYAEALRELETLHEWFDQNYPPVWTEKCMAYVGLNQPERALPYAERHLKRSPNDPQLMSFRLGIIARMGRTDEAYAGLKAALEQHPSCRPLLLEMARCCARMGRNREGRKWLDKAIKGDQIGGVSWGAMTDRVLDDVWKIKD